MPLILKRYGFPSPENAFDVPAYPDCHAFVDAVVLPPVFDGTTTIPPQLVARFRQPLAATAVATNRIFITRTWDDRAPIGTAIFRGSYLVQGQSWDLWQEQLPLSYQGLVDAEMRRVLDAQIPGRGGYVPGVSYSAAGPVPGPVDDSGKPLPTPDEYAAVARINSALAAHSGGSSTRPDERLLVVLLRKGIPEARIIAVYDADEVSHGNAYIAWSGYGPDHDTGQRGFLILIGQPEGPSTLPTAPHAAATDVTSCYTNALAGFDEGGFPLPDFAAREASLNLDADRKRWAGAVDQQTAIYAVLRGLVFWTGFTPPFGLAQIMSDDAVKASRLEDFVRANITLPRVGQ